MNIRTDVTFIYSHVHSIKSNRDGKMGFSFVAKVERFNLENNMFMSILTSVKGGNAQSEVSLAVQDQST